MRKKHLMQVRKVMAAFLAVAMIGQNSLVTTAESYVVENQAIVAQEENQYEQDGIHPRHRLLYYPDCT